jgi:glucosamine--fructose-6-phosphate aminotransferase (isomerizing)
MCGIVGYVGAREALPIIVAGLEGLEYRGYDSAGVAVSLGGKVRVVRAVGKLTELKKALESQTELRAAHVGLGHTRWATHGRPSETNAHPHTAGRVSLIHNGIIENYLELRERLTKNGSVFLSETDTEAAAHLMNYHLEKGLDPFSALKAVCSEVRGSYAFLAIDSQNQDRIVVAKNSTPIILGLGEGETFVASDIPAILPHTRRIIILEDGDIVQIEANSVRIENNGKVIERPVQTVTWDPVTAQKGGYKHFMLKEIHDQGRVLADTIRGRVSLEDGIAVLPEIEPILQQAKEFDRIVLVACGTAWHACLVGKFYLESLCKLPVEVDYASEFRYREPLGNKRTLVIAVSQSGETLDTLGALELAAQRSPTMAVCNVLGSSIARKSGAVVYTRAGPEISVASTKAFTTQLVTLQLFALAMAKARGTITEQQSREAVEALTHLPAALESTLMCEEAVLSVAKKFYQARDFLFLGRGSCYPIALEGALKLKEISYIHAEGYPAGEMKHGPIALIDERMPVVMVMQRNKLVFEKTLSNLKEVEARGGRVIVVTDAEIPKDLADMAAGIFTVPYLSDLLSPMLLAIPLQFLAYQVAVLNGTDVDLPRNLAKSVTVE